MTAGETRANEIARAFAAEAARNLSCLVHVRPRSGRTIVPDAYSAAPSPLLETVPDKAREIYQGRFTMAGVTIEPGTRSPFSVYDAPANWRRAIAAFNWLGDLAATDSELARVQARCLISDWIGADRRRSGPGWELTVLSQRLVAWFTHAPFFLTNSSGDFHAKLMASTGRQIRHLNGTLSRSANNWPTLYGAIALNYAAVCAEGIERIRGRAEDVLNRAIENQMLPDGGHVSRNPARVVDLLEALLPLKDCFVAQGMDPPESILRAIDRLFPLLRLFLHGDNGLAFFNGASETRRRLIAAILARDSERAKPLKCARQSGYSRLAQGKTVIIADTGVAGSARASETGHAGTLSFEMSYGAQRMIVNCGHCPLGPNEWRAAARATAAHTTLAIADRSSARVICGPAADRFLGGPLTFGPRTVTSNVKLSEAGELLSADHDGYVNAFGFIHRREIYLAKEGTDVRGEDRLVSASGARPVSHPFSLHFHLHPSIKATLSKDNNSVLLVLPDKSGWLFSARGALMKLEESVCFVDRAVPHRTLQIVLFAESSRTLKVQWALKHIDRPAASSQDAGHRTSRLPLDGGRMN